jgi:hypothetical protein
MRGVSPLTFGASTAQCGAASAIASNVSACPFIAAPAYVFIHHVMDLRITSHFPLKYECNVLQVSNETNERMREKIWPMPWGCFRVKGPTVECGGTVFADMHLRRGPLCQLHVHNPTNAPSQLPTTSSCPNQCKRAICKSVSLGAVRTQVPSHWSSGKFGRLKQVSLLTGSVSFPETSTRCQFTSNFTMSTLPYMAAFESTCSCQQRRRCTGSACD